MTDPPCPRCGAPLPPGGECARCLLQLGLELPPRDPSAASGPADAPPSRRPVPLPLEEVARRFPQLEITALVGQGGMAVVYRARQPRLGRDVALKLLPPEQSRDPAFAERFLREARAMARLAHPNIVAVHDFGESDGLCWLLMDFVDGVNLRQAMATGALPPEKALAIVPQMCDALQYAHDEGVVHRDIKPENVLVDRAGRVKIADFGLAKLIGPQDATLTGEQQVFGTPHYMAPEQMEAARDVDHRADIFSLGVVFYEMLTGRLPVGLFEPPSRRVQVDVRLDDVVLHALEHDPSRRYQHAAEVKTDVESVVAGREPPAARAARPVGEAVPRRDADAVGAGGLQDDSPPAAGRRHGRRGRLHAAWVAVSVVIWITVAWRWAGELAVHGPLGLAAGVVLLALTAWVYLQIAVHAAPRLRDALQAEPRGRHALRVALGAPALVAGLLLLGLDEVESWERGVLHYSSSARSPQALLGVTAEATDEAQRLAGAEGHGLALQTGVATYRESTTVVAASQALGVGLLLLAAFGAVSVAGAAGSRRAWVGPVLLPLVFVAGLRLAEGWSDVQHDAEAWPALQPLAGRETLALDVAQARDAVRRALERDGYAVHAEQAVRFVTPSGDVAVVEECVALEPRAPWDRWDLEDGVPRRRRPHVALRFFGAPSQASCVVTWDCGHVRALAGEDVAWREWLERILRDAGRFTADASGG